MGSNIEKLASEFGFFNSTLQVYHDYDVLASLQNSSIVPDVKKSYSAQQLDDALKASFGFAPTLGCVMKDDVQYLHEIAFCLSKSEDLHLIDCDKGLYLVVGDEVSNCKHSEPIMFPPPA